MINIHTNTNCSQLWSLQKSIPSLLDQLKRRSIIDCSWLRPRLIIHDFLDGGSDYFSTSCFW